MNYEIIFILTSIMLFCYWFNYILGGPLSDNPKDVNERAILFRFPLWLAKRKITPKYIQEMKSHFYEELNVTSDFITKVGLNRDMRKNIFLKGRELFSWEKSILCPICFHYWLSVIAGFFLIWYGVAETRADYFTGFLTYLVNHLLIRKIS